MSGDATAKRLCRNITIHGYCKFENKGCEFKHELVLRIQPPANRPVAAFSSVSADSINAPVFVPKDKTFAAVAASAASPTTQAQSTDNNSRPHTSMQVRLGLFNFLVSDRIMNAPTPPLQHQHQQTPHSPSQMLASLGMIQPDPYYYMNSAVITRQPLQFHLYNTVAATTPNMSRASKMLPSQRTIQSLFMPDTLHEELTRFNEAILRTGPVPELGLPDQVHMFHSLYPLEGTDRLGQTSLFFNIPISIYKATSMIDGQPYVLCRVEGVPLLNERAMILLKRWRSIQHCNLVALRDVFATQAFNDTCNLQQLIITNNQLIYIAFIFVYDYFPCAQTLYNNYFTPHGKTLLEAKKNSGGSTMTVPENTLWSYIIQIASAIRVVHSAGLAVRNIDATKVLVTSKHRLRIQGIGVLDVLSSDVIVNFKEHQQADFYALGRLIINLACLSPVAYQDLPQSFENNDMLENELSRELGNGNIARSIIKMGFITERPEFDMDPSWSETGDRYIITLFRDYVFHQVDENGSPVLDMTHVLGCLNKLDACSDEKIMLMSRDERSCLIVSYKEVWNCILSAYRAIEFKGRRMHPMHF
ncbi:hypothetical protein BX666DRAFT_1857342 [Dichotomocladium elegans]|nr:hypothetical protein BX666DRAFT_1857342 [Dichotomocladium elegans]